MGSWLLKSIIGITLVYLAFVGMVFWFQEKLLFFPDHTHLDQAPQLRRLGFSIKEFTSPHGDLRYYIRRQPESQATLLVFHGNAGRAADRGYLIQGLLNLPIDIVIAEYPGYAGSAEKPGQKSLTQNAQELFDHLMDNNLPNRILVMGESLGTGVAVNLASQRPVQGLILISPYPSISKVAQFHYPYLPVSLLIRHPFPSHKWAADLKSIPVLAFHGEEDEVIPYALGEKFWQSLPAFVADKKWVSVPGAHHNDLIDSLGSQYPQQIKDHFFPSPASN
ncbi:MAG: alpha/beta hydrolase [Bdellovibrionaceae bacterium]|nr:alpha/beta hydrolase [Bdellovibrionales bacterium]MCB9083478.1 alpha/beta hydrolase [Pseudobdellovibrionaceae bacterium]